MNSDILLFKNHKIDSHHRNGTRNIYNDKLRYIPFSRGINTNNDKYYHKKKGLM